MKPPKSVPFISKLTNKFCEIKEENSFLVHNLIFQAQLAILIPFMALLWNIMNGFVEIVEEHQSIANEALKELIAAPIFLVVLIISIIRQKKAWFHYNSQIILFCSLLFLISIMIQDWIPQHLDNQFLSIKFCTFIINGVSIQIVFSILSASNIAYFLTIPIKFGISVWLFIKIAFVIAENSEPLYQFTPHFIYLSTLLLYNLIMAFWMERNSKNMFHLSYVKEVQLTDFKDLLHKTITSPVIILSQPFNKILFGNDAAFALFLSVDQRGIASQTQIYQQDDLLKSLSRITFNEQESQSIEDQFLKKLEENNEDLLLNKEVKLVGKFGTSDGEMKYLSLNIMKCLWEGHISTAICINDISIYKDTEIFKDKIIATVSHNLRTPLMTINAQIENVLQEKWIDVNINTMLEMAHSSVQILISTVCSMLDYSLLSRGCLQISNNWFNFESFIKPILKCFTLQSELKGLLFRFKSNINRTTQFYLDSRRINQILIKLLSNAVKFTTNGFINLQIELLSEKPNAFCLKFQIEDSGPGIAQNEINSLFKFAFRQEGQPPSSIGNLNNEIGDVNIGLQLCNELVKLIGQGEGFKANKGISVWSEKQKGTKFSFTFWLKEEDIQNFTFEDHILEAKVEENKQSPSTPHKIKSNPNIDSNSFANKSILIVDDEPFCLNIVCQFAKVMRFGVIEKARNGRECLDVIERYRKGTNKCFSLIVMDCDMPEMNGLEASKKINEMIANNIIEHVHIMALTANVSTADEEICRASGMQHYLSKPVSLEQFREKIIDIFKGNQRKNSSFDIIALAKMNNKKYSLNF